MPAIIKNTNTKIVVKLKIKPPTLKAYYDKEVKKGALCSKISSLFNTAI